MIMQKDWKLEEIKRLEKERDTVTMWLPNIKD